MKYVWLTLFGLLFASLYGCVNVDVDADGDKWRNYGENMADKYRSDYDD